MKQFIQKFWRIRLIYKLAFFFSACFFIFVFYFTWVFVSLPELVNISDYQPPLLTEVYDKHGEKTGEFFKQRRILADYEDMPEFLIQAFISAEDGSFFHHKGLNYRAILRAFIANLKAGRKVQGGSTITQQLARTLLLSSEKTYTRKFKEAILALRMESSLTKQDILYIYLNQIYLGHGSYGVEMASRTYFRKSVKDITLAEAALLAGLPKAPSRFSPVINPDQAKSRQIYVLNRMRQEGYINEEEMKEHLSKDIKIFVRKDFSAQGSYYLEAVRLSVLKHIKEKDLLEGALKIYTAMDLNKQKQAGKALKRGLEEWDKRKGFRGVVKNLADKKEREEFLKEEEKKLRRQIRSDLILPGFVVYLNEETDKIPPDFFVEFKEKFKNLEEKNQTNEFWFSKYEKLKDKIFLALVSKVSDEKIEVLVPWGKETILLEDFIWAVPVENKSTQDKLTSSHDIFKTNDVISLRVKDELAEEEEEDEEEKSKTTENFIPLEIYQEPLAESALISFDLNNSEIIALVGGYDYSRSQYNRAYQSRRQSGSAFKPFVYGAALERGFRPNTLISDSPVVFTPKEAEEKTEEIEEEEEESLSQKDLWRPSNISDRFLGDLLFRKALVRSLNVPTVRIIEKTGLDWVRFYVRRLGIFSPLNQDFTMALGSSSLTLYETLKAFSVFARRGRGMRPILIHRVEDSKGTTLVSDLSLDDFFTKEIEEGEKFVQEQQERWFKEGDKEPSPFQKRWQDLLKQDGDQLIPPSNSYVLMNLLEAVVKDSGGTAGRARVLNRPVGGKTGTTDGYYDTWFVGSSPFISTAVWVGFDSEKSLGRGETGSRTALPIWIDYMEKSHEDLAPVEFSVPEGVVFANIDGETGQLVSRKTKEILYQAFIEGTEPSAVLEEGFLIDKTRTQTEDDEATFLREEL